MSSKKSKLTVVGISMGDCNGVGPEIILKTYQDLRMFEITTPIVYGSKKVLDFYKKNLEIRDNLFNVITSVDECKPRKLNIIEVGQIPEINPG
jgi:4-hydroxythreonine-4-phosphate dehydrogenase